MSLILASFLQSGRRGRFRGFPRLPDVEPDATIELYEWHDFEVETSVAAGNKYDARGHVDWVHVPTGTTRRSFVWYSGTGDVFVYRFGASFQGLWIGVSSSDDAGLDGLEFAVFVDPSSNPIRVGWSGRTDHVPTAWARQKGPDGLLVRRTPRLAMTGVPQQWWDNTALLENDLVDKLDNTGFNGIHIPVIGRGWFDVATSADSAIPTDATNPDPRCFAALEFAVEKVSNRGGWFNIWTWGKTSSGEWFNRLSGGLTGAASVRIHYYIGARLNPLPTLIFSLGYDNEFWVDLTNPVQYLWWIDRLRETQGGWHHWLGARFSDCNKAPANQCDPDLANTGVISTQGENFVNFVPAEFGMAEWEHWKSHTDDTDRDNFVSTFSNRVLYSSDRYRRRNEGRVKDFATDPEILDELGKWANKGIGAVYGRNVDQSNTFLIGDSWPNKADIKAANLAVDDEGDLPLPPPGEDTGNLDTAESLSAGLLTAVYAGDHPTRERVVGANVSLLGAAGTTGDPATLTTTGVGDGAHAPLSGPLGANHTLFWDIHPTARPDFGKLYAIPFHGSTWEFPWGVFVDWRSASDLGRYGYAVNADSNIRADSAAGWLSVGSRIQVAVVRQGDQVHFYRNGVPHSQATLSVNSTPDLGDVTNGVLLNRHAGVPGEGVTATLPAFAMWNRALSAGEIAGMSANPRRILDDDTTHPPFVPNFTRSAQAGGPAVIVEVLAESAHRTGAVVTMLSSPVLSGATVEVDGGQRIVYVPPEAGDGGTEALSFRVSDDGGQTSATLTINVAAAPGEPPPPGEPGPTGNFAFYAEASADDATFFPNLPRPAMYLDRWNAGNESQCPVWRGLGAKILTICNPHSNADPGQGGSGSSATVQQMVSYFNSKFNQTHTIDGIVIDELSRASQNLAHGHRAIDALEILRETRPTALFIPYLTSDPGWASSGGGDLAVRVRNKLADGLFDFVHMEIYQQCDQGPDFFDPDLSRIDAIAGNWKTNHPNLVPKVNFIFSAGRCMDGCNCPAPSESYIQAQLNRFRQNIPNNASREAGVGCFRGSGSVLRERMAKWQSGFLGIYGGGGGGGGGNGDPPPPGGEGEVLLAVHDGNNQPLNIINYIRWLDGDEPEPPNSFTHWDNYTDDSGVVTGRQDVIRRGNGWAGVEMATSWDSSNMNNLRQWALSKPGRWINFSQAIIPNTHWGLLEEAANGDFDAHFVNLAANLAAHGLADPNILVVFRPGYEFNANFFPWGIAHNMTNAGRFREFWKRIIDIMRNAHPSANWKFDWNPTHDLFVNNFPTLANEAYPGNDYVDIIGIDIYDRGADIKPCETRLQERWDWAENRLNKAYQYALDKGKLLSVGEWGIWNTGCEPTWGSSIDNPFHVEKMHAWITARAADMSYHCHFNELTHHKLTPGTISPLSAAEFRVRFGPP